jgi:hypothetical protein
MKFGDKFCKKENTCFTPASQQTSITHAELQYVPYNPFPRIAQHLPKPKILDQSRKFMGKLP